MQLPHGQYHPSALFHHHLTRNFTDAALALNITLLSAVVDLVSFSGILYSIYPPLFLALLTYSGEVAQFRALEVWAWP